MLQKQGFFSTLFLYRTQVILTMHSPPVLHFYGTLPDLVDPLTE